MNILPSHVVSKIKEYTFRSYDMEEFSIWGPTRNE